jgi:hypothetical protein
MSSHSVVSVGWLTGDHALNHERIGPAGLPVPSRGRWWLAVLRSPLTSTCRKVDVIFRS